MLYSSDDTHIKNRNDTRATPRHDNRIEQESTQETAGSTQESTQETSDRYLVRVIFDFGKGFDESNLRYMRLFYRCFPKRDTLRHELTWSHYRRLISVENEAARLWYMNEAADSVWSTRQMGATGTGV